MKKTLILITMIISLALTGCGENKDTTIREKNKYSEAEYKALCSKIDYNALARNPDDNFLKKIYGIGKIAQVIGENNDGAEFQIYINPIMSNDNTEVLYFDDLLIAFIPDYDMNNRLLKDDIIYFWGMSTGLETYKTISGESNTVPTIQIDYYKLK